MVKIKNLLKSNKEGHLFEVVGKDETIFLIEDRKHNMIKEFKDLKEANNYFKNM